jgi:hypothetical protein
MQDFFVSRGTIVSTATSYGLDGMGFESQYGQEIILFLKTFRSALWGTEGFFMGGKTEVFWYTP